MTTRTQTVLISIIALMAGLGFAATTIVLHAPNQNLPQRESTLYEKIATSTLLKDEADLIRRETQMFEHASTTAVVLVMDKDYSLLLQTKSFPQISSQKFYFLWMMHHPIFLGGKIVPSLIQSFTTNNGEVVSLVPYKGIQVQGIIDSSGSRNFYFPYKIISAVLTIGSPEIERYYLYTDSIEKFAFESNPDRGTVTIRRSDGIDQAPQTIQLVHTGCKQSKDVGSIETVVTGLRIGGVVLSLPSLQVACRPPEGPGTDYDVPMFTFSDFDPEYSALTLSLLGEEIATIDLDTKEVILKKERYNVECSDDDYALSYITPSGTIRLVEDVRMDPLFKGKLSEDVCLYSTKQYRDGNPLFDSEFNFGEGYSYGGTFEFNLKTHQFQKIK